MVRYRKPMKEACDMAFMMLGIGFALLPLLLRLALRLRLGIPLLYSEIGRAHV